MATSLREDRRRDIILNGPLLPVIITIAAPIFLYNLFDAFYSLFDAMISSSISAIAVSATATLTQIKSLLSSLGAGIAAGAGIIVSRLYGANRMEEARKNSNIALALSLTIVTLLIAICIPFARPFMKLGGATDEMIDISYWYYIVSVINLVFIFLNSLFIALQKARGNTIIVFVLNLFSMAIKMSLSIAFVYGFKVTEIYYLAIATMVANMSMFIVLFAIMLNKNNVFQIRFKEVRLKKKEVWNLVKLSFPIFLGKFIFSFGKVSVNKLCAQYGTLTVGALGVSNNLCGLVTSPVNSFEETTSTIVSQNLGNKNQKRAFKAFWNTFFLALAVATVGYILVRFVFQDQLISLFNHDEKHGDELVRLIKNINNYDSLSIVALAINAAVLGVLYGYGQTKSAMILNISRVFVFRIPSLIIIQQCFPQIGAEAAGMSMAISNIGIGITSMIFLFIFYLKIKKHGYKDKVLGEKEENSMKIGSRCHDIKRDNTFELVKAVKDYGFDSVQLVLKKAIKEFDFKSTPLTEANTSFIANEFKDLNVAMLGAYFNPVHENKEKVKNDVEYFKSVLKYSKVFNCKYVGTETGSYNNDKWTYNPLNQTEEGYQESKSVLEPLVRYAESIDATCAFEGAWGHVMYKPSVLKRLYDEINSPNLKIIVDVYNYLYIGNHQQAMDIFNECIELFGDNIVIFHIKDYIVNGDKLEQTCLGKGLMPLDKMIPIMKQKCPNATLVFEGSKEEDLEYSMNFIKECLK